MENILLIFLSDVKFREDKIQKTVYTNIDGEPAEITNESAIRYLLQNIPTGSLSKIFIFASNSVRRDTIKGYLDESGNTVTHLEYFKRRMKKFLPNVESCINDETIYNYDEDNSGEENLKSVAEMAERIQNYSRGKNICLHTDLTGGMRHINMMMLDVIRLLEYSGVATGKLIYSNFTTKRVEEVKNIYDLFQLIAGVEEFVNFGSVAALKKYYNANSDKIKISGGLKNLIMSMENFAEAIKLCRYGNFKNAVIGLHDAINDFSADTQNLHDVFMARLIEKIREKYSPLIATRGEDDLKIIRWCILNGYLQQSLTLYTERIPEYLGENFITQSDEESAKLNEKLKGDRRRKYFYLIAEYLSDDHDISTATNAKFKNINKIYDTFLENNAVEKIMHGKFNYDSWRDNLQEYFCIPENIDIKNLIDDEFLLRSKLELLNKLYGNPKILLEISAEELAPIKNILKLKSSTLRKNKDNLVKILKDQITRKIWKEDILPVLKIDIRVLRVECMLERNIFSVTIPEEKFIAILKKYYHLKDERNNANHANETAKFSNAKELEDYMLSGIDEIEEAIK